MIEQVRFKTLSISLVVGVGSIDTQHSIIAGASFKNRLWLALDPLSTSRSICSGGMYAPWASATIFIFCLVGSKDIKRALNDLAISDLVSLFV